MKHAKLRSFTFILVAFMLGCNEFMVVGVLSDIARSYHVPVFLCLRLLLRKIQDICRRRHFPKGRVCRQKYHKIRKVRAKT